MDRVFPFLLRAGHENKEGKTKQLMKGEERHIKRGAYCRYGYEMGFLWRGEILVLSSYFQCTKKEMSWPTSGIFFSTLF